jgi:cathepsin D
MWSSCVANLDLTIQGKPIIVPTNDSSNAAVDTGTTLIGAPVAAIEQIVSRIPGSFQGEDQYKDYILYRMSPLRSQRGASNIFVACNATVVTTISFGGRTWGVSPQDFELLRLSNGTCLSAFFRLNIISSSAPKWIIGDTFLVSPRAFMSLSSVLIYSHSQKNVYSVFRHDPPAIGFANLSAKALALNTAGGALPTPSLGAPIVVSGATVNAQGLLTDMPPRIFLLGLFMFILMTFYY